MYLYEKKDDKILVHTLEPDKEAIYDYKTSKIKKIPFEKRVVDVNANILYKSANNLEKATNTIEYSSIVFYSYDRDFNDSEYSKIISRDEKNVERIYDQYMSFLEDYYESCETSGKLLEVLHTREDFFKYIILTNLKYKYKKNYYDEYVMEDIICVPRSLFFLEKFFAGEYDQLNASDLKKLLELFKYLGVKEEIDYPTLKKTEDVLLVPKKSLTKPIDIKVHKSEKVLSLINKNRV